MVLRKRTEYAPILDELRTSGIEYLPVVWSAYGRPHPDAVRVITTLARAAARRRGTQDFRCLGRRIAARITAALWRRAANMILACWPATSTPAAAW